jgi:hypothetical protein
VPEALRWAEAADFSRGRSAVRCHLVTACGKGVPTFTVAQARCRRPAAGAGVILALTFRPLGAPGDATKGARDDGMLSRLAA